MFFDVADLVSQTGGPGRYLDETLCQYTKHLRIGRTGPAKTLLEQPFQVFEVMAACSNFGQSRQHGSKLAFGRAPQDERFQTTLNAVAGEVRGIDRIAVFQ